MTTAEVQRGTIYRCAECRHCGHPIEELAKNRWLHARDSKAECGDNVTRFIRVELEKEES